MRETNDTPEGDRLGESVCQAGQNQAGRRDADDQKRAQREAAQIG